MPKFITDIPLTQFENNNEYVRTKRSKWTKLGGPCYFNNFDRTMAFICMDVGWVLLVFHASIFFTLLKLFSLPLFLLISAPQAW